MNRQKQMFCLVVAITMVLVFTFVNYTNFIQFSSRKIFFFPNRTQQIERIHIVSNYPLMYESPWKENQWTRNSSLMQDVERQMEIEEVLQKNLDHPLVEKVHLLVDQESAEKKLRNLSLGINKHKLIVKRIDAMPKWRHFWSYVSDNLLNRLVAVLNMDVYLGEGFEKVNKTFLVQENVCYALTRHGQNETRCDMSGGGGYCGFGYSGAHDGYITAFTKPIPESVLRELDFEIHLYGNENVLLWILKNRLAMKLLNPCKHLKIFHVHCVPIRGIKKLGRINWKWGKSQSVDETGLYF